MKRDIVLTLMQLKGISRKTIVNNITITNDTEYSVAGLSQVLEKAKEKNPKIKSYTQSDLSKAMNDAQIILENCKKLKINMLSVFDEEYPVLLRNSDDPPSLIYYIGDLSYVNKMNAVAIIGTREPSEFSSKVAFKLGDSFANRNFVDVSGLAIGCDTEGHKGCLNAGGKTIAVMAGGLNSVYPAANKGLAEKIVEKGGALLSEYPPYAVVYKGSFVERDRIQAALCSGIMVIETGEKGGTLHAVNYADKNKRLIGCFKHTEKYKDIEQAVGNKKIVSDGMGIFIANDKDLDDFCERLNKKWGEIKNSQDIMDETHSEYVQLSLFDEN